MDKRYPFELRSTNFHAQSDHRTSENPYDASLDVISRHCTLQAATRAMLRRASHTDCTCGCAVVVSTLPDAVLAVEEINSSGVRSDRAWALELAERIDRQIGLGVLRARS
jgi:hypothetical protein